MKSMDDGTFRSHVTPERNDFYNWVKDVHKDEKLANELLKAKTRQEAAERLIAVSKRTAKNIKIKSHKKKAKVPERKKAGKGKKPEKKGGIAKKNLSSKEYLLGFLTGILVASIIAIVVYKFFL